MTRTRHATHRTQDCRWSVPSFRREPTPDGDGGFEAHWACEHARLHSAVTADDCARCPYWAPLATIPASRVAVARRGRPGTVSRTPAPRSHR